RTMGGVHFFQLSISEIADHAAVGRPERKCRVISPGKFDRSQRIQWTHPKIVLSFHTGDKRKLFPVRGDDYRASHISDELKVRLGRSIDECLDRNSVRLLLPVSCARKPSCDESYNCQTPRNQFAPLPLCFYRRRHTSLRRS